MITNDITDFRILHRTVQSYQMIETLISICMFRTLPGWQQAIHLSSHLQSINHLIFSITRMHVPSLNSNLGTGGIEVFIFQFALKTTINGVSEFSTKFLHVEIIHTPAYFLIRRETDTDFPVLNLRVRHQIFGSRHDLCNTRFIVSTQQSCPVGRDQRVSLEC